MKNLVSGARRRATSAASSRSNRSVEDDNVDDDTLVVEPDQGNILTHIISQLRPGADLSRVVLPTFFLEPRSMLERITNFMCHPEMLLPIPQIDDRVERFVSVVKFYLSGWHIRPPGVKKPLNPILGEIFTSYWDFPDGTRGYYISEQTSHHPPKSSYFYMVPEHHIRVDGTLKPRSKFLGNSAASVMEGIAILTFLNRTKNGKPERYILTQPNMYARGILFGRMKYELGDNSCVRCPELGLVADIEFRMKGWVTGTYNAIGGTIRDERTNQVLLEISGFWNGEMYFNVPEAVHKDMFFDAVKAKPSPPKVRPLEEQEERESQRLWAKTAKAVKERNYELATDEKTKIEDTQRQEAARRSQEGVEWNPRLFKRVKGGPGGPQEGEEDLEWIISANIDASNPKKQTEQILSIYPIIDGQKASQKHFIPPHDPSRKSSVAGSANPAGSQSDDLIDFGQDDHAGALQQPLQPDSPPQKERTEIEDMLHSTGTGPPAGSLLDFQHDILKELPRVKRSETEESNDTFHDCK